MRLCVFLMVSLFVMIPISSFADDADDTADDTSDDTDNNDNQFLGLDQSGNNVCVTVRIGMEQLGRSYLLTGGNEALLDHYVFDAGDTVSESNGVATFVVTDFCVPNGSREYDLYFYDSTGSFYQLAQTSIEIEGASENCDESAEEACPNTIGSGGGGGDDDDDSGCGGCGVTSGADAVSFAPFMLIACAAFFLLRKKI